MHPTTRTYGWLPFYFAERDIQSPLKIPAATDVCISRFATIFRKIASKHVLIYENKYIK
jgi:hypothetical protein